MREVLRVIAAAAACACLVTAGPLEDARALAVKGDRGAAIRMLEGQLVKTPEDLDVRVLLALVLSWEGRYEQARTEFEAVLQKRPDYPDAVTGLINLELWSQHPERAEEIAAGALSRGSKSTAVMAAQVRALRAQNREREALDVVNRLLVADPTNREALASERSIQESMQQWKVGFTRTYEWFSHGGGAWNQTDANFSRGTALGTVGLNFSRADRYGLHSNLGEVTFYPRLRRGTYLYAGFGYSHDGALFPHYRIGAEIFQSLARGFEASAGYRKYGFGSGTNLFTGSVGKYVGKWLLTTRVYLTPDDAGLSHSVSLSARRFLAHTGDYVDFRFGTGASPFDPRSKEELATLNAYSGYVHLRKSLGLHWSSDFLVGLALEDRLNRVALEHYVLQSTLNYRF